jgi:hypothetical protein
MRRKRVCLARMTADRRRGVAGFAEECWHS